MSGAYLFKEVRVANPREVFDVDIRVSNGRIIELAPNLKERCKEKVLDCAGLLACPGLINAHDHLQFNLYSRIGNPPYENSYEWGNDIRLRFTTTVESIERVPTRLRYLWGAWKNLFSGVTLVMHHDPYSHHFRFLFPISVFRHYTFAHSLGNETNIVQKLNDRKQNTPFVIHLAEGTDDVTGTEVETLKQLGGMDERTVVVHAINISPKDIDVLKQTGTSVVWCPSSNQFLFGKTAPVYALWGKVPVALGTDSTLTGSVTMFEEMQSAHRMSTRSAQEILQMVTETPRRIFNLPFDAGQILESGAADFFLLPSNSADPYEAILNAHPEDIALLMRQGKIIFSDDTTLPSLQNRTGSLLFGERHKTITNHRCIKLFHKLRPFLHHYSYLNAN